MNDTQVKDLMSALANTCGLLGAIAATLNRIADQLEARLDNKSVNVEPPSRYPQSPA